MKKIKKLLAIVLSLSITMSMMPAGIANAFAVEGGDSTVEEAYAKCKQPEDTRRVDTDTLTAARKAYDTAVAKAKARAEVVKKIENIGDVEVTTECFDSISRAETAYNNFEATYGEDSELKQAIQDKKDQYATLQKKEMEDALAKAKEDAINTLLQEETNDVAALEGFSFLSDSEKAEYAAELKEKLEEGTVKVNSQVNESNVNSTKRTYVSQLANILIKANDLNNARKEAVSQMETYASENKENVIANLRVDNDEVGGRIDDVEEETCKKINGVKGEEIAKALTAGLEDIDAIVADCEKAGEIANAIYGLPDVYAVSDDVILSIADDIDKIVSDYTALDPYQQSLILKADSDVMSEAAERLAKIREDIANCTHENLTYHPGVIGDSQTGGYYSYYECDFCHKLFSDSEGKNQINDIPYIDEPTRKAIEDVVDLIDAIDDEVVDSNDKEAIEEAREAYDNLTDNQKTLVNNYEDLTNAEKALKNYEESQRGGGGGYVPTPAPDPVVDEDVQNTEDLINAIDDEVVDANDKEAIEKAREAYDNLTDDQKALVDEDLVKKLTDDEAAYKEYINNNLYAFTSNLNAGLKVSQTGKKIEVKWGKVEAADYYAVYVNYCGKTTRIKYAGKTVNNYYTITKINGKKLNLKKNYKIQVRAYAEDGTELSRSIVAHIVGTQNTKYTNPKRITLTKTKYTLAVGKTANIKAKTVKVNSKKKLLGSSHAAEFRYRTSDNKVVTVNKNGKITAKGVGTATVYVYAKNGYARSIKVVVK